MSIGDLLDWEIDPSAAIQDGRSQMADPASLSLSVLIQFRVLLPRERSITSLSLILDDVTTLVRQSERSVRSRVDPVLC